MTQPIRILQVLGGLDAGGAESFVMNLYRAIDRRYVQFDFVKHTSRVCLFEPEIARLGGQIFVCPRYTGKNHFRYLRWWSDFFANYPEYRVIHGHVRSTAALYLAIANRYGLITIAHSHSTSNGTGFAAFVKKIMQLPIRYTADYLFACSNQAGAWLYGKKALSYSTYKVIPNGVDIEHFLFDKCKREKIRSCLGIGDDEFVIGHVGRFTEAKNHKFLVELFLKYHKYNPKSRLLMVGDGELFASVKAKCEELGIAKYVILPGSRADTAEFYQAMDAFVFPSLWEGLGIAIIEAQANGLQCFVSENIPTEALVEKNVKVLPLNSMEKWISELKKNNSTGRVTVNQGLWKYDIQFVAEQLQKFYVREQEKADRT